VSAPIEPWARPAYQPTGRPASIALVAFADEHEAEPSLVLRGAVPPGVPLDALDLRNHARDDGPEWFDGFRTGALRNIAATHLGDLRRLDAARSCATIRITVEDPPDLTHLQLAWAVAAGIAAAGAFAVLDVHAVRWHPGAEVAALAPGRPFDVRHEINTLAETTPTPGFGHPVHTRGMHRFARPDLVAGVPAERIEETGALINHLAARLAEGHVLEPGQVIRIEDHRTFVVEPYAPGGAVPELNLNNDGLLLVDA
jgi:hypothetical protein